MTGLIHIGSANGNPVGIFSNRANRHGFVAGATGTGKTVTLQRMAEQFSLAGVPVFMADVKGDLTGIGQPERGPASPVKHWDLFGRVGQDINVRLASMGPELVSRMLELSETQSGVITIAFHVAVRQRMQMDTLDHLSNILRYIQQNSEAIGQEYGRCSSATISTILRKILVVNEQAGVMFGKANMQLDDLMKVEDGRGVVNLLDATDLISNGNLYSTFLLWLLNELFAKLPEVGDAEKPKLVFFFDEAHLLFKDAPKSLVSKVEQVVRLIRSKGVGIYFVTQKPNDIPDMVLSQLSNRVQHALRAYTPNEQKALRAAAQSFRSNPAFDSQEVLQNLKVGQALVSTLDQQGVPQMVQLTDVELPDSKLGPADPEFRPSIKAQGFFAPRQQKSRSEAVKTDSNRVQKKVWRGGLLSLVLNR